MRNSYWSKQGKHQKEYDATCKFIPLKGASFYKKGEIVRAASRIYYDLFNNGFGNDWSSFAAYLFDNVPSIRLDEEINTIFLNYGNGVVVEDCDFDYFCVVMNRMIDLAIEETLDIPDNAVNNEDSLFYSTAMYKFEDA